MKVTTTFGEMVYFNGILPLAVLDLIPGLVKAFL